jgi:methylmalonyl-CoA/ethylmalonyl-CoA epimerase
MKNIEHIGLAVKDLATAVPLYELLLNTTCYKTERLEEQQVTTAFFQVGGSKLELLEGFSPDSVIGKFIEKNGEGMHHIAFAVEDIEAEMKRLQEAGFRLLQDKPLPGADNKLICFLHPKDAHGVLVELCMEMNP